MSMDTGKYSAEQFGKTMDAAQAKLKELAKREGDYWSAVVRYAATIKILSRGEDTQLCKTSAQFILESLKEFYGVEDVSVGLRERMDLLTKDADELLDVMFSSLKDELKQ